MGVASSAMELFYNGATFIKLVIAKKLQIESLTRTKLIFARSQLTEANVKCRSWIRYKLPKLPAAASVGGFDHIEYVRILQVQVYNLRTKKFGQI